MRPAVSTIKQNVINIVNGRQPEPERRTVELSDEQAVVNREHFDSLLRSNAVDSARSGWDHMPNGGYIGFGPEWVAFVNKVETAVANGAANKKPFVRCRLLVNGLLDGPTYITQRETDEPFSLFIAGPITK